MGCSGSAQGTSSGVTGTEAAWAWEEREDALQGLLTPYGATRNASTSADFVSPAPKMLKCRLRAT